MSTGNELRVVVLACVGLYQRDLVRLLARHFMVVGVVWHAPASARGLVLERLRRHLDPIALWRHLRARWLMRRYVASAQPLLARLFLVDGAEPPLPGAIAAIRVDNINDKRAIAFVQSLSPDVVCVNGTNLLRQSMLALAASIQYGFINLHTGLSPYSRGGNCNLFMLLEGRPELVGITIHHIDKGIDSGAIIITARPELAPEDNYEMIEAKSFRLGNDMMAVALRQLAEGRAQRVPQWEEGKLFLKRTGYEYQPHLRVLVNRRLAGGLVADYLGHRELRDRAIRLVGKARLMGLLGRIVNRCKDALFNPLLERYWRNRMRGRITSLLYHQVDASSETQFLARGGAPIIAPQAFRQELAFLKGIGVRFFTFEQIAVGAFPAADEPGVAVCFDDCFVNNYTAGLEVLEVLGVKATFFQSTAMVDADTLLWEHRLYWHTRDSSSEEAFRESCLRTRPHDARIGALRGRALVDHLREEIPFTQCEEVLAAADAQFSSPSEMAAIARRIYPTAQQLRLAHALGHEIASHGHRHLKRSNIPEVDFEEELARSAAILEQITGKRPRSFSYPFNSYLPADAAIVGRYFSSAATVDKRTITQDVDPMRLPRFTWPGPAKNSLRMRRWLLTGTI